jgi:hypothetical protein
MPLESTIAVFDALNQLAVQCYPEHVQLVDDVLNKCLELINLPGEYTHTQLHTSFLSLNSSKRQLVVSNSKK